MWWNEGRCGGMKEGVVEWRKVWWNEGRCGGVEEGVVE